MALNLKRIGRFESFVTVDNKNFEVQRKVRKKS